MALALRGLFPGATLDRVPVIYGSGGKGKSPLLRLLAFDRPELFTDADSFADIPTRDLIANVSGAWVVEVGEMGGMGKRDRDRLKLAIGQRSDKARALYTDDEVNEVPRVWVPIVTANPGTSLPDLGDGDKRLVPITFHGVSLPVNAPQRDPKDGLGIDLDVLRLEWPDIMALAREIVMSAPKGADGFPQITWPAVLRNKQAVDQYRAIDPLHEAITFALFRALEAHLAPTTDQETTAIAAMVRRVAGRPAVDSAMLRERVNHATERMNPQHAANEIARVMREMGCDRKQSNGVYYWLLPAEPGDMLKRLKS